MTLVTLHDISIGFGSRDLFEKLNLSLESSRRYALVGRNGTGKSTLAGIISGSIEAGSGRVSLHPGVRIATVDQAPEFDADSSILDALGRPWAGLRDSLRQAEEALAAAGEDTMEAALAGYQAARDAWDSIDGDGLESRGTAVLESLGMPGPYERPVSTLSGGELGLLALAAAVSSEPDLLILDEPGNHLDFRSLAWLEAYLGRYQGALLIISHNRYLMDRLCTSVLELDRGVLTEYPGNYSDYRLTRLKNRLSAQATWKARRKHVDRLEELVRKFEEIARRLADSSWGKRLRSRRTQLERAREDMGERPAEERSIDVRLGDSASRAEIAVRVDNYSRSFGDNQLFAGASAEIRSGDKVALLGPNGCGKTTLVRDLLSRGDWNNGDDTLRIGPSFRVGYMAQDHMAEAGTGSLEDHVREWGHLSRDEAFDRLSPLGFRWDDLAKPLGALSGGELARVQLARLYHEQADLLILDEPTNHLDAFSREAVEEALTDFPGTILVISHDRYFLDKIVDRVLEVRDGGLVSHSGGFSDWWADRGLLRSDGRVSTRGKEKRATASPGRNRTKGPTGSSPVELGALEGRIEGLEAEKRRLEEDMNRAFAAGDYDGGRRSGKRLDRVSGELARLWKEWEQQG